MSKKHPISAAARERLRRGRQPPARKGAPQLPPATSRRAAATTCGWCAGPIASKATGRIPTWCSHACRQRAWEQKRAAESGRSAVTVVERIVAAPATESRRDWPALLGDLAADLDRGRIYRRDLHEVSRALKRVLDAHRRSTR